MNFNLKTFVKHHHFKKNSSVSQTTWPNQWNCFQMIQTTGSYKAVEGTEREDCEAEVPKAW